MKMRSTNELPPSASSRDNNGNNVNNNNYYDSNNSSSNSGNSGSQYALCALGVGLVALGIVMIVWSVVPADVTGNIGSSSGGGGGGSGSGGRPDNRNKVSSVAFVLVGSGVVMLLLSLCLGMRNKQREQQRLQEAQNQEVGGVTNIEQEDSETAEERAQRFAVPSYEEVVGSGQYPISQSNLHHCSSQLPSYEDLVQVDGIRYESEGPEGTPIVSQPAPASAANAASASSMSNRRGGKTVRKLLPLKIRRIKSEKLPMKNVDNSQSTAGITIEPLTPPPQYDDKVAPL